MFPQTHYNFLCNKLRSVCHQWSRKFHPTASQLKKRKIWKDNRIVCSVADKENCEKFASFLFHHYMLAEPKAVALGRKGLEPQNHDWFLRYVRATMKTSIADVSMQAIDQVSGKMVAAGLAAVTCISIPKPKLRDFVDCDTHPVTAQLLDFIDKLEEGGLPYSIDPAKMLGIEEDPENLRFLELIYGGVHPGFRFHGVITKMLTTTESLARNVNNCRIAYAIVSSEFTYKACLDIGFKPIRELRFADYKDPKGVKIFAGSEAKLGPHAASRIMLKELRSLQT